MTEETTVEVEKPSKKQLSTMDKFGRGAFGYIVGFAAEHAAEKVYEKLIIEGRLKAFLRRK